MDVYRACLGCGEPTPAPRCPTCQAEVDRRTNQKRGGAHARGYTRTWQKRAAKVTRAQPACAVCGATSDLTVDHVVPKATGGNDDRDNLRTLCRRCNSSKGGRG